jgi:hypothetical protein
MYPRYLFDSYYAWDTPFNATTYGATQTVDALDQLEGTGEKTCSN